MSEQQQDAEIFVVSDDETVYRLISSPTGYNEVTGVSPDCFKLFRKNESYVSVERAKYCSLDDALSNGNKIKMWFADGETFWGLACLLVKKIRKHELLDVISKYTESHPGHAGILMSGGSGMQDTKPVLTKSRRLFPGCVRRFLAEMQIWNVRNARGQQN